MTALKEAMNQCWDICSSESYRDNALRTMSAYICHLEALITSHAIESGNEDEVAQRVLEIAESLKRRVSFQT